MTGPRSGPGCSSWRALERAERVDQAEIREWVARARLKLEAEMGAELARQACDAVAAMFEALAGGARLRAPVMQELEARRQRLPSREVDRFNAAVRQRAERLAATDELEARRQVLERAPRPLAHKCGTCDEACSCDLSPDECAEACHVVAFGEASS